MCMSGGLKTARDLYEKLKHDGDLIQKEVNSYDMFNFMITAYHILEWIKGESSISRAAKKELKKLRRIEDIQICRDIANANKHFAITRYAPVVSKVESQRGFGVGRYGVGGFGRGEESITITLSDGINYNLLEFKNRVIQLYESYFVKHKI